MGASPDRESANGNATELRPARVASEPVNRLADAVELGRARSSAARPRATHRRPSSRRGRARHEVTRRCRDAARLARPPTSAGMRRSPCSLHRWSKLRHLDRGTATAPDSRCGSLRHDRRAHAAPSPMRSVRAPGCRGGTSGSSSISRTPRPRPPRSARDRRPDLRDRRDLSTLQLPGRARTRQGPRRRSTSPTVGCSSDSSSVSPRGCVAAARAMSAARR